MAFRLATNHYVKVICPQCQREIPLDDVNVAKDVALCRACVQTFSFSELSQETLGPEVDFTRPPRGVWVRQLGGGFEVGSTTRSAIAFFLVPFTLFWSGGALGGIYGSQIFKGQFDPKLSLFGLPFLIGSLFLVPIALISAFGKLVVRGEGDQGSVFLGVGPVGWTRRFRWSEIKRVHRSMSAWTQNNRRVPLIELEREQKPVRFGTQLSEKRRDFMLAALKRLHATRVP
jgi:hypothetical protein